MAEAAPREFLAAVERAVQRDPCPYRRLFAEEGKGAFGSNYLTGVLWGLETLAWDEQFLTAVVVLLADLSRIDPGGNWANRPVNSLTTIFLPWCPQTTASAEKREVAMRTMANEAPASAWPVLLSLLPNQHQMSSGCCKPRWRQTIPEDGGKPIAPKKYWDEVTFYAQLALELAQGNVGRLKDLIDHLDSLPRAAFDGLLVQLGADTVTNLSEEERMPAWLALEDFTARHRRFASTEWALAEDVLQRIDAVARKLAPVTPFGRYRRLFREKDSDLVEGDGTWEEKEQRLNQHREAAVREIYELGGTAQVVRFAKEVESASRVGSAMAAMATAEDDNAILPKLLGEQDKASSEFIANYIWCRRWAAGWQWVDKTIAATWTAEQRGLFLRCLPFCTETWDRVTALLGHQEAEYWLKVPCRAFQVQDHFEMAVDKLLEYRRPGAAIDCLYAAHHRKVSLDQSRTVKSLLAAARGGEAPQAIDIHHCVELIKALQNAPDTSPEDLLSIEWAYLPALDGHRDARPRFLEQKLAADPQSFCEIIRTVFRSTREDAEKREPTAREQSLASNVFRLLHGWKTTPGTLIDGTFSPAAFTQWFEEVKRSCIDTGHIEVALSRIGHALIHAPADPGGLWIHETVAAALNARDAEDMRSGFSTGLFNARGAHWVDPTGKPELELAAKYKAQADAVETAGYHRLAATMRDLSASYARDADRIIAEHRTDKDA